MMIRYVYEGERQFQSIDKLKDALSEAWFAVITAECKKLVESMTSRFIAVVQRGGAKTDY